MITILELAVAFVTDCQAPTGDSLPPSLRVEPAVLPASYFWGRPCHSCLIRNPGIGAHEDVSLVDSPPGPLSTGWIAVGSQRRCETRQSLRELDNQRTIFIYVLIQTYRSYYIIIPTYRFLSIPHGCGGEIRSFVRGG